MGSSNVTCNLPKYPNKPIAIAPAFTNVARQFSEKSKRQGIPLAMKAARNLRDVATSINILTVSISWRESPCI